MTAITCCSGNDDLSVGLRNHGLPEFICRSDINACDTVVSKREIDAAIGINPHQSQLWLFAVSRLQSHKKTAQIVECH